MKKLTIISAVVIFIVLMTVYFVYEINFDSNWKLEFNDLKAMFKPSVPYTLDVDIDDIEYASYSGSFADWEYHRGSNNKRLKKLINMFNHADVIPAPESELPNISPDATFNCYDKNQNELCGIGIYGGVYFKDYERNEVYRYRSQRLIEDTSRALGFDIPW